MSVTKQILKDGNGVDKPKKGDVVTMHYTGTLLDGQMFDSSVDRGKAFVTKIGIGKVIKGWDEGIPTMTLGEKAVLTITSDYAYGDRGFGNLIPPRSTLIFNVELLAINDKKAS